MKLLQLIITAFMFGATSLICWIYYRLNAVDGDLLLVEHNTFLRETELAFYAFIAALGLCVVEYQVVGIIRRKK